MQIVETHDIRGNAALSNSRFDGTFALRNVR